jgi:prepilin signal peptidase PulO-like enzyme (type II secretory pathway)
LIIFPYASQFIDLIVRVNPVLPPEQWWMTATVFGILAAAALIDSFTATVPDLLLLGGLLAIAGMQGMYVSWSFAGHQLLLALESGALIFIINFLWFHFFHHDALGMGDAKWTMLAVSCFGIMPALYAWGIGACLAVVWMLGLKIVRYQVTRVYFVPFLFIGLLGGLWWVRLKTGTFVS